jgi:hypothetical protein
MTEQDFAAGHVFFRLGDPGERAYLLHDGQVEVLAGAEGTFTRVGLFEPGEVFGEMALIEERPRAFTARAMTAGRATSMTRAEFEHQLTHDPARTRQYLRSLFERLRSLTARLGGAVEAAPAGSPTLPTPAGEPGRPAPAELPPGSGKPSEWTVVLHPLTRKSAKTLPDAGLRVTRFPLRIGRASAAHEPEAFDLNDLWLLDDPPFNVSRNHCEIHVDREGPMVRDRGSQLGCVVNDDPIGGRAVLGYARLVPGDNVLVIGSRMSPYQFRVTVNHA